MEITIDKSIDSFQDYKIVNKKTALESVFDIEIMTLKQILEVIIRVSWINPIFITSKDSIYVYIENEYISTWLIVENLWGYFEWIKNTYFKNSNYYIVSLSDIELLHRDILNKRNGFEKYVKIAFTKNGLVYKHDNCNLSIGSKKDFSVKLPFCYDFKSISYVDGELMDRRKIINQFYPELMDILTYFPVRYNDLGISYITDRLTILGKLTHEVKNEY